jgi:CRP-like cAMP-binding protein
VGLPATLTGRNYCMTATVTDDAKLGFLSVEALKSLLREQPALRLQLLDILGDKMAQVDQLRTAMQNKETVPAPEVEVA